MRAVQLNDGAMSKLVPANVPEPHPGRFEMLIRVHAAGVTRTELGWYPTSHTPSGEPRTGAIPGHEFSGVVCGLGEDVGDLELGREVYGMNDWFAEGAVAEYCVAPFYAVAPKPVRLTHAEAATVPISALTAWQGLIDRARIQPGDRVLVQGGAGAVGLFAVQLAKLQGAYVIATAAEANADFVRDFGADQVIDRREPFEARAAGMDIVFDTVGGDVLQRSWSVLKPGGRMVTIVEENSTDPQTKAAFFIVEPNHKQLSLVAGMFDCGKLRCCVDAEVPLAMAPEAYSGKTRGRHRGKVVVTIQ